MTTCRMPGRCLPVRGEEHRAPCLNLPTRYSSHVTTRTSCLNSLQSSGRYLCEVALGWWIRPRLCF
eukprot:15433134-Alexandrium_andersonii.AAC.1